METLFDPLTIKNCILTDKNTILEDLVGKNEIAFPSYATGSTFSVTWSDNRKDNYQKSSTRRRIDTIMDAYMDKSNDTEFAKIMISDFELMNFNFDIIDMTSYCCEKLLNLVKKVIERMNKNHQSNTDDLNECLSNLLSNISKSKSLFNNSSLVKDIIKLLFCYDSVLIRIEKRPLYDLIRKNVSSIDENDLNDILIVAKERLSRENVKFVIEFVSVLIKELKDGNTPLMFKLPISELKSIIVNCIEEKNAYSDVISLILQDIVKDIIDYTDKLLIETFMKMYLETDNTAFLLLMLACYTDNTISMLLKSRTRQLADSIKSIVVKLLEISNSNSSNKLFNDSLELVLKLLLNIINRNVYEDYISDQAFIDALFKYFGHFIDCNINSSLIAIVIKLCKRKLDRIELNNKICNFIVNYLLAIIENVVDFVFEDVVLFITVVDCANYKLKDEFNYSEQPSYTHNLLKAIIDNIYEFNDDNGQRKQTYFKEALKVIAKLANDRNNTLDSDLHKILLKGIESSKCDFLGLLKVKQMRAIVIPILCSIIEISDEEKNKLYKKFVNSLYRTSKVSSNNNKNKKHSSTNMLDKDEFFSSSLSKVNNFSSGKKLKIEQSDLNNAEAVLREYLKVNNNKRIKENPFKKGPSPMAATPHSDSNRLCLTTSTRENIEMILESIDDPVPLLLEGATGVGKSAAILEAAKIGFEKKLVENEIELIRFNMSSQITIEDLMGKPMLKRDKFEFDLRPFSLAYKHGHWLLLDELNLAPDIVLQSIESALDNDVLHLFDQTNANASNVVIEKHKNFRLFATQNPNSGFFKGKREKLSNSFLDRFRIIVFKDLDADELVDVVISKLNLFSGQEAHELAKVLVYKYHEKFRDKIDLTRCKEDFPEWESYSTVSIRELIKLVSHIIFMKDKGTWHCDTTVTDRIIETLSFCVYGARYRGKGRKKILEILNRGNIDDDCINTKIITIKTDELCFDEFFVVERESQKLSKDGLEDEWERWFSDSKEKYDFDEHLASIAHIIHKKVEDECLKKEFIDKHGLYLININWMWYWIESAKRISDKLEDQILIGKILYQTRFVHNQVKEKINEIFNECGNSGNRSTTVSKLNWEIQNENLTFGHTLDKVYLVTERPFVLTNRVKNLWKQLCISLQVNNPILVTG